ncbi:MAG: putative amidase AmiD [Alphaproteobacteria bacterium MarineAlpha2_Bin1]|nr:MAG: putative amidase AmiD [Alphaproteobacteria bacterium MarineAlpha2_Bin1]|tara:strand:+ start:28 stop:1362 length:1335 start_codon:yes stop_codon:yes gene_type:complete
MRNLHQLNIHEISTLIESKKASSLELSKLLLKRILLYDKYLNSFIYINEKEVLKRAKLLDYEINIGKYRGLLHGVPISIKDAFDMLGVPTTVGSKVFLDSYPSKNSNVVKKLLNAGSIILGKNETTEFCFGGPSSDSAFLPAKNPWDLNRWTGGSSGGGAAAVASQLCFGSIGTDTGGSVRLPAAWCGIVGFMPTPGSISRTGVFELSNSLDAVGVLTKSIFDATILTNTISKKNNLLSLPEVQYGKKIGIAYNLFKNAEDRITFIYDDIYHQLEKNGFILKKISEFDIKNYASVQSIITVSEAYKKYKKYLNSSRQIGFYTRSRLCLGAFVTKENYQDALTAREKCIDKYGKIMENYDFIILPSAMTLSPSIKSKDPFLFLNNPLPTTVANVVGVPSIVLPWSIADGLPTSIQILGKKGDDQALINFAYFIEKIRKKWVFPRL